MDVVIVHLEGDFAGWTATFKSLKRVSARTLVNLESDSVAKRLTAYAGLILSIEGWKDSDGEPTNDPLDAPIAALEAAAEAYLQKATALPNA